MTEQGNRRLRRLLAWMWDFGPDWLLSLPGWDRLERAVASWGCSRYGHVEYVEMDGVSICCVYCHHVLEEMHYDLYSDDGIGPSKYVRRIKARDKLLVKNGRLTQLGERRATYAHIEGPHRASECPYDR